MKNNILALLMMGLLVGCSSTKTDSAAKGSSESPQDQPSASADNAQAVESAESEKETPQTPPPSGDEKVEVKAMPFDSSTMPGDLPAGKVLGGFAFKDSAGDNYVVATREDIEGQGDQYPGSVLHIKHVAKSGEQVQEVRSYTERVEDCDLDLTMETQFGDWSVSDLDKDGIGEANFAYSVSCKGGLSPDTHKVFVTEGGEKYVLRGRTLLKIPGEEPYGGEYKADKMPAVFLEKAEDIWKKTSVDELGQ